MGQTPDALRAEIEGTRTDMSLTMDAIGDRVNPRQAARRQARQARDRISAAREAVMGRVEDATGTVQGAGTAATSQAQSWAEGLQQVPPRASSQVRGNPLAAGLIAFGGGLLLASILPTTERERQVAAKVGQAAQPAVEQAQGAVQDMKQQIQAAAQDAAGQVKDTAAAAAEQVKRDVSSSAQDLSGNARDAAGEVRSQTQDALANPGNRGT
jgi:hypothetical protein